jgi:hypothetical protein
LNSQRAFLRLKSNHEEERDSRERYKQMARGRQRAVHLLNEAILSSLRTRGLENFRIMVRVYKNLVGLSKTLSKVELCGPEKRSLAPFAARFKRSNELFSFLDAGELKENAEYKIRVLSRHFVDNTQFRHIYLAGCHDVGCINELISHRNNRNKVTLVRNHATRSGFTKLGMRIEDFPGILRTTLTGSTSSQPYKTPSPSLEAPSASSVADKFKASLAITSKNDSTNMATPVPIRCQTKKQQWSSWFTGSQFDELQLPQCCTRIKILFDK